MYRSAQIPRTITAVPETAENGPGRIEHRGLQLLGEWIMLRLGVMKLSATRLRNHGGPSRNATMAIVHGYVYPRAETLANLDTGLKCPPGTAQGILEERINPPDPHAWLDEDQGEHAQLLALRRELTTFRRQLSKASTGLTFARQTVNKVLRDVDKVIQKLDQDGHC
ncbi:Uncharacterised protein [Mycobacteroides abscessus subsp. abscessus]|uniref:Uncharacterized protein n=1 Tax=Mycobacteroides abscessus subsp. bolletii CRM-0020 TaxID=1306401 RepID=A0A829HQ39_9MYCO|nr:hypothetical protein J108_23370 [Mycobacteroides abscessus subsp. bolletii CRM-0020]RIS37841.1 hypothetical protein D2E71_24725 [Mycobacteroides abscessus]SHY46935.1 Uncharacterised protein [Mycobacteroides abscessus subsp. abscessus]SKQ75067.1 Uncharacterised protein [Mycobacteroides abscessus subsp. massiliense]RIS70532.1 hypothetical protein D2E54_24280 [Mycobacteroides abscessus]